MFQLYLQQKCNINRSDYVYHFNISYHMNEKEAAQFDFGYFEQLFEEVHLTKQENREFFLKLFDLKKTILQEFDYSYRNKLLDDSYIHIIDSLEQQEILIIKKPKSGYLQPKKINTTKSVPFKSSLFLNQLIRKHSFLKNRYGKAFIIIPTPFIKWTIEIEEKISLYFGSHFQDISLHIATIDDVHYIVSVDLHDLKEEQIADPAEDLLLLIQ